MTTVTITGINKNWQTITEMTEKEAEKRFLVNNPKNGHHSVELFYGWGDERNKTVDYYNFGSHSTGHFTRYRLGENGMESYRNTVTVESSN